MNAATRPRDTHQWKCPNGIHRVTYSWLLRSSLPLFCFLSFPFLPPSTRSLYHRLTLANVLVLPSSLRLIIGIFYLAPIPSVVKTRWIYTIFSPGFGLGRYELRVLLYYTRTLFPRWASSFTREWVAHRINDYKSPGSVMKAPANCKDAVIAIKIVQGSNLTIWMRFSYVIYF